MRSPTMRACAPTGVWQLVSSVSTTARSASRRARAAASAIGSSRARVSSPLRVSSASSPWPGAGTNVSGSSAAPASPSRPRRRSPASASRAASHSPSASLRSRVSTLPRSGTTSTSARSARSCERRRRLEVPTRAPAGSASIDRAPTSASCASSPGWHGRDLEARGQLPGHVLRAVHREVDLSGEQRLLDLLHEPRLVVGPAAAVAARGDRDQLGLEPGMRCAQQVRDVARLDQRQGAAARADTQCLQRLWRRRLDRIGVTSARPFALRAESSARASNAERSSVSRPNSSRRACT